MLSSIVELSQLDVDCLADQLAGLHYCEPQLSAQQLQRIVHQWESVCQQVSAEADPMWFRVLKEILKEAPWPHAVLNTVDIYLRKSGSVLDTFRLFETHPRSLEILAKLACGSSFLTQTLLDHPDALEDLTLRRRTAEMKSREQFLQESAEFIQVSKTPTACLVELRRFQRREILRVGMCDAFGFFDLRYVTLQLSLLADAMVQQCLQIACEECGTQDWPFVVLALGKHGGEELNYSSDIDLILVSDQKDRSAQKVARRMIDGLNQQMQSGFLYRVDMRLRPWGDAGPLVCHFDSYLDYLRHHAELWEKQALLKARIVAGDEAVGRRFLQQVPQFLYGSTRDAVLSSIRANKQKIEQQLTQRGRLSGEVKLGAGSIRDIEFLVQAQQLIHGQQEPRLAASNTLDALVRLAEFSIIDVSSYRQLRESYIFLRSLEHVLQLLHNQQTHRIPDHPEHQEFLARRMDYPNAQALIDRFQEHQAAVCQIFDRYLPQPQPQFTDSQYVDSRGKGSQRTESQVELSSEQQAFSVVDREQRSVIQSLIDTYLRTGQPCLIVHGQDQSFAIRVVAPDRNETAAIVCGLLLHVHLDVRGGEFIPSDMKNRWQLSLPTGSVLFTFLCTSYADVQRSSTMIENLLQPMLIEFFEASEANTQQARRRLLAIFCDSVRHMKTRRAPDDVKVDVRTISGGQAVLKIEGDDSCGFLFELTHSLALCGFQIGHAYIQSQGDQIVDEFEIRDFKLPDDSQPNRLPELKTAVTLIRKFTAWLPSATDPEQAVLRFHHFVQQLLSDARVDADAHVQRLFKPELLEQLCSVLGFSQYLWDGFAKIALPTLIPLISDSKQMDSLPTRAELTKELEAKIRSSGFDDGLNSFKDYHLFRIELRHVLGKNKAFGNFSQQITELAEVVVNAAFEYLYLQQVEQHGQPHLSTGQPCQYCIAGLGKFGGIEMGFASDIELMVIYEGEGRTNGQTSLSNRQFFDRIVLSLNELIKTSRNGIFAIDLRMRPYGKAGSPAVSMAAFATYFAHDGDSWPYERQSLVKLRTVAGSAKFQQRIHGLRDSLIYTKWPFDFDSFDAVREKQRRQLLKGGQINCKLSDGGLVDCEYAVQALQMSFGQQYPALRTTNTLAAIQAALQLGLLTHETATTGSDAYIFFRQLIDCLRMARGHAKDLTVPAVDSPEFAALQRRMLQAHGEISLSQIEETMNSICRFAQELRRTCQAS